MDDSDSTVLLRSTRKQLEMLYLHLQVVQAGISCASLALRHQHCEQDDEVATVLDHYVGATLSRQLDRTREMISSMPPRPDSCNCFEPMSVQ